MINGTIYSAVLIKEYSQYKECKYLIYYNFRIEKRKITLIYYGVSCSKAIRSYGRIIKNNYDSILTISKDLYYNNLESNNGSLSDFFKNENNWPEWIKIKSLKDVVVSEEINNKIQQKIKELNSTLQTLLRS